jgi:hypothetical protein
LINSKLPVKNPTEAVLLVVSVDRGRVVAQMVEVMPFLFLGRELFVRTTGTAEALTLTILRGELPNSLR